MMGEEPSSPGRPSPLSGEWINPSKEKVRMVDIVGKHNNTSRVSVYSLPETLTKMHATVKAM